MNSPEHTDNTGFYSFGGFVLDPAGRELKKGGQIVDIEPRAFDVLIYLVRNRDRAVNKDELQDAVWPGMIVTETALTRAVMKARKAVDDDATTQAVIKTLHGHGYRFIADLISGDLPQEAPGISPAPPPDADASATAAALPVPWMKLRTKALMAVVLVVAALLLVLFLRAPPLPDADSRIAVLPLLDSTGNPELAWSSLGFNTVEGGNSKESYMKNNMK